MKPSEDGWFEDESTELEFPDQEPLMIDAVDIDENATPGEYVEVPIDSVEFEESRPKWPNK